MAGIKNEEERNRNSEKVRAGMRQKKTKTQREQNREKGREGEGAGEKEGDRRTKRHKQRERGGERERERNSELSVCTYSSESSLSSCCNVSTRSMTCSRLLLMLVCWSRKSVSSRLRVAFSPSSYLAHS